MAELEVLPRIQVFDTEVEEEHTREYYLMNNETQDRVNRLIEVYGKALMVDMNGVLRNMPRLSFIKRFEKKSIWVDTGAMDSETVMDILISGAEKAVMRTSSITEMEEVERANEVSDQVILQLDLLDGRMVASSEELGIRNPRSIIEEAVRIGIRTCLYVDTGKSLPGPDLTHGLPEDFELYVGLLRPDDSSRVANLGFKGIVVDSRELI